MPIYTWADHKNEKVVEVIRTFDDYKVEPIQEECDWDISEAKWERIISANIGVKKAWRWGGGKGNWIALIGVMGWLPFLDILL